MSRGHDLLGQRFGKLSVISLHKIDVRSNKIWLVRCDCGNESLRPTSQLIQSRKKSEITGSISMCSECSVQNFVDCRDQARIRQKIINRNTIKDRVSPEMLKMDPFLDCSFEANEAFRSELMEVLEREICPRRELSLKDIPGVSIDWLIYLEI